MQPKALKFADEAEERMSEVRYQLRQLGVMAEQATLLLGFALCMERGDIGEDDIPDLVDLLKAREASERDGSRDEEEEGEVGEDGDTGDREGVA